MTLKEIADTLEHLATLLEINGENEFRIKAYKNAARAIDTSSVSQEEFISKIQEGTFKGIGPQIGVLVLEIANTGTCSLLDEVSASLPPGLPQILELPGLGAKKVKSLYENLGIESLEQLEVACKEGRVSELSGFGKKTEEKILSSIAQRAVYQSKFLHHKAEADATRLIEYFNTHAIVPVLAGSLRRGNETVKDIDLLITSEDPSTVMQLFYTYDGIKEITSKGEKKSSAILQSGISVDVRVVAPEQEATAILHFTGSANHNEQLRARAKRLGMTLNEYSLTNHDESIVETHSEADVYHALGLSYIEPERREGISEIELAETCFKNATPLPTLVTSADIKGVLHAHSTYSDGIHTLREMALAAKNMGYEYLGISDHSKSAFYANGLKEDAIKRQHEEIDALNQELAPFVIFKGIESDILADGSLDYSDKVLESFDFVIASVHSILTLSEQAMTERVIKAIEHPATTILGHISGRLLLRREAFKINIPKVMESCAEHKVAIELNANPKRLELDWRYHQRAVELGISIPICPDAHSIEGIKDINRGVKIARKGGLESKHIATCLGLEGMKNFLKKKKT